MKLGIKVGPETTSIINLERTNAPYCEIWFNVNDLQRYNLIFDYFKKHPLDVGLHFWGALPDNTWANFAYPDTELIKESVALIQKTIDIAAQNHFVYVNIHPGTRTKTKINFERGEVRPYTDPVDELLSEQLFLEHALKLHDYATNRGIVFTIETVPQREATSWYRPGARNEPEVINCYQLPLETLVKASKLGMWIANDLCHTAANKQTTTTTGTDRNEIARFVMEQTNKLFSQTRLVHVGFLVPPYNGTDFHDHLDNPILDSDQAIPNKNELKQLLNLFKNRDDVWAIVEPVTDHVKNYFLLQKLTQ